MGYVFSIELLGFMHSYGNGIEKDYVEGYKWLYIAQSTNLSNVLSKKEIEKIKKQLTKEQIKQGKKLATEWLKDKKLIDDYWLVPKE